MAMVTKPAACDLTLDSKRPRRRKTNRLFSTAGLWVRLLGIIAFVFLSVSSAVSQSSIQKTYDEYDIKAAFLYNFLLFVEWPQAESTPNPDPYVIAVLGEDPFGEKLDDIAKTNKVRGRTIVIKRISRIEDVPHCHILFISSSQKNNFDAIQKAIKGKNILTVADYPKFAEKGGAVELFLLKKKVNFYINLDSARSEALKINVQLLRLAKKVIQNSQ